MKITTIKIRLIVAIMVTSLLSLCVACLVYSLYDFSRYRSSKENEVKQLVQLVSPLLIQDLSTPDEQIMSWQELVREHSSVQSFVLYQKDFTVLDSYVFPDGRNKQLSPKKGVLVSFSGDYCLYHAPVQINGEVVGYVAVDYYLSDRVSGFRAIFLVFVVTVLFGMFISYLLAYVLQSQFNKSITSLVDVARAIYQDKNYEARAVKQSDDEFGLLTDTINEMLDEISRREVEMKNLNDHLESRVETRTSALQEINSRLLDEKMRADQASSVKSNFLANMSHEIRTPMNGIVASCDLAIAEDLSPKVANYLKIIQSSSRTLLLIINDILDFSKLEAGTLELEEAAFSLAELLCKLGGFFREQASQNNIKLTLDVDSQTPDVIVGDRGRLQQMLSNLLDNAIKFTHEGQVSLNIVCLEKKDESVVIECRVSDTGVGLNKDGVDAIFQSFHQVDSSSTKRFGGTGLGLAITRKLATMMGGTIEVSSQLGQGSTFILTVKFGWKYSHLAQANGLTSFRKLPQEDGDGLHGKHVLLAVDHEVNRGLAEALLTGFDLTVDSVENGGLALRALDEIEYDFVILDMQLPILDGYETISRIREQEQYKELPVIALVSRNVPYSEEKCLQAGATAYLYKPVSKSRLKDVLLSLNGCNAVNTFSPLTSVPATVTSPIILDVHSASRKLGVDIEVYYKVLRTFYYDYGDVDSEFIKAVADENLDWLKKRIHSLKGSSATIGAEKLTGLATAMDLLCKDGVLPSEEQVKDLLFELQLVKKEAKQFISAQSEGEPETGGELQIVRSDGLEECFSALAQALDESLYDQINKEIEIIEENITGSPIVDLGKLVRMYAYDEALELLRDIVKELGLSLKNNEDVD